MLMNDDFFNNRPQELCKMCGICCRLATSDVSYNQLQAEAKEGLQASIDFLRIFDKYETYEEAYKMNPKHVEQVTQAMREVKGPDFVPEFYHCKYIQDNNTCGIYETRPPVCRRAPASPWMLMPPECGFNGWLKDERAKHMRYVIGLKEMIQILETYPEDYFIEMKNKTAKELIEEYKHIIDTYKRYGADNW